MFGGGGGELWWEGEWMGVVEWVGWRRGMVDGGDWGGDGGMGDGCGRKWVY